MANYWAKIWIDMLDDRKVGSLPDSQYRRWVEIILIAKEYNQDGILPTIEDMAWRLRPMTTEQLTNDMAHLARAGMVELKMTDAGERWFISKFTDRQRASTNTERTNMHREWSYRERYPDSGETQLKRSVSQKRKEVEKKRKEKEAEAEAEKNGASADAAAAALLSEFGLSLNATTAQIVGLDADYIRGHLAYAERRGETTGLAIRRMTDGDPVPGERKQTIPAEYAEVIQR